MHKPRLARLAELHLRQPIYFLTLCTFERKPIIANPGIHAAFQTFSREAENHSVYVGRYVLMPDHLHFFALFSRGATSLSAWVKSLKNTLSKTWRSEGVSAPHWQKGFFDHVLRSADSYAEKCNGRDVRRS
jgi:putative transposase